MTDWVALAKSNPKLLVLGAVFAALIGVPWSIANFYWTRLAWERGDQLHAQERAFHDAQLQQARSQAKSEAHNENLQRHIASLEADNLRLRDALKQTQADLAKALAADAAAQIANTTLQRDQELRRKLDAYVDQALAQTAALDTIADPCQHFAAWKALVDLRERIATMAPLLSAGANSYLDWLQQSGQYVKAGMLVPQCAMKKTG